MSRLIKFSVDKRRNTYNKSGIEWAFNINFGNRDVWTLRSWVKKPSGIEIKEAEDFALRCFDVYHRHIEFPRFDLKVTNDKDFH